MVRGSWWDIVHGVAKSQTRLSEETTSTTFSGKYVFPCVVFTFGSVLA